MLELLDSEDEGITLRRNVDICSLKDTALYRKGPVLQQRRCEIITSCIYKWLYSHLTYETLYLRRRCFSCDVEQLVSCFLLFSWGFKTVNKSLINNPWSLLIISSVTFIMADHTGCLFLRLGPCLERHVYLPASWALQLELSMNVLLLLVNSL